MFVWSQFIESLEQGEIQLIPHSFNNYRRYTEGLKNKPRRLPWHRIHLVKSGTIVREIGSERFVQKPGALVWQFPHTTSRFEFPGPCEFYGLHFDLKLPPSRTALKESLSQGYLLLSDASHYSRNIQDFCALYNQNRPLNPFRCTLRLSDILCRIIQDTQFPHRNSPLNEHQKALILEYIHENCGRELHSRDAASLLNYSPDYFSRLFKENYGVSFRRYQMEERIRMAGLELMTGDPGISSLAVKYGYQDIALFSRQFKAVMGLSPRKYRDSLL